MTPDEILAASFKLKEAQKGGSVASRSFPAQQDPIQRAFDHLHRLLESSAYDDDTRFKLADLLTGCEVTLGNVASKLELSQSIDRLSVQEQFKRLRL